jgi:hypothetical protein
MKRKICGLIIILSVSLSLSETTLADSSSVKPDTSRDSTAVIYPPAVRAAKRVIDNATRSLSALAEPIAVLMVIFAAFLLITSASSEDRVRRARATLLCVIIGLAVLILSKTLVNLVKSILGQ